MKSKIIHTIIYVIPFAMLMLILILMGQYL
jgi:hypothetical protein